MNIFNGIRRWRNKRYLNSFRLRKANEQDIDFVMAQLITGAQEGHYGAHLLERKFQIQQRLMFSRLLNGVGTMRMGERGPEKLSGSLWIYGNRAEGNVGYMYVCERYEGSGESEVELMMAGIDKQHRNMGHGKKLIENFISLCPSPYILYARCYVKSESMYQILLRSGFRLINVKPGGTRELERK